jgi:two-component system nitrogen regulation response regulator NtrX
MDVKMAGIDGSRRSRSCGAGPAAIVVMISGHATIQTAVEATQHGAYDILEKPLDTDRILVTLRNALAHLDLHEENTATSRRGPLAIRDRGYLVRDPRRDREDRARGQDAGARAHHRARTVRGRSSSARAIHGQSTRAQAQFIEVNCAAIPSELIESELFGHMKGSFTGAVADRAGSSSRRTAERCFLDEIGDMSLAAQAEGAARAAGRRR